MSFLYTNFGTADLYVGQVQQVHYLRVRCTKRWRSTLRPGSVCSQSHPVEQTKLAGRSGLAAAGPQQEPEDEAEHRQQQNEHDPQHLLAGAGAALHDAYDRPYVRDQDQQSEESSDLDSHNAVLSDMTLR